MTPSLHKRVTLGGIGFALLLFIALMVLESYFIQRVAQFYVTTRLEHDGETLLAALQPHPDNQSYELDASRIHPIYLRPFSGHYFQITLPGNTLRSRSLWDEPLNLPQDQALHPRVLTIPGPQGESLLVLIQRYTVGQDAVTIATAESLAQLDPLIRQAQIWSAAAASVLLIVLVILQYRWMSAGLSPLQELQRQLKELQQGKRQQLVLNKAFAELEPLINETNHLITALDDRIGRHRNAIGNLAHALKTPVSALQQLAQSDACDPSFKQALETQLKRIRDRIDNELKRARIAGAQGLREKLNVRDEIIDLSTTLKKIHHHKAIDIVLDIAPGIIINADRQDFLELVGNLLDNACKWARQLVEISAEMTDGGFRLTLEDDGPGCDAAALNRISQRGTRLDEKNPGHGLGLAIAEDIVSQYAGELHFSSSPLGGLAVAVRLPQQG